MHGETFFQIILSSWRSTIPVIRLLGFLFGYLSRINLLGWTDVALIVTTAPPPIRSFLDDGIIKKKITHHAQNTKIEKTITFDHVTSDAATTVCHVRRHKNKKKIMGTWTKNKNLKEFD